ncbi:MAG: glycosyltransferase [Candidatus Poseidoniaceae archaeon]
MLVAGHEVTVLGPDVPSEAYSWTHVQLDQSSVKGRKASSLAKNMRNHLKEINLSHCVLLIDWALVKPLSSLAETRGARWICIDRSPPADANLLAKMQQSVWKKAWKLVASSLRRNGTCIGGTVVSLAHQALIKNQFSINDNHLCIVHAGVDNQLFQPTNQTDLEPPISMVYHGKMDRHRGILKLILLLDALENNGIEADLNLIGSGDLDSHLTDLANSKPNLHVHGSVHHLKIPTMLQEYDIGLLPMPNLPVWTIASPLKRSEYISSGLLVLGIDHSGHHLPVKNGDAVWHQLFLQQTFVDDAVKQIQQWIEDGDFATLSQQARAYAETNLAWSKTIQPLVDFIEAVEE